MSNEELNRFDPWSAVVIALTLVLFLVSVFVKGFTHELLLEAGVFLVSIKLILMAQKNSLSARLTVQRLERIASLLERIQNQPTQS
jgi:protein-S-isoprenylcysteine O-methyltransferase Ste14